MISVRIVIFSTTAVAWLALATGVVAETQAVVSIVAADVARSEAGAVATLVPDAPATPAGVSTARFDAFRAALDRYGQAVHRRMRTPGDTADARLHASAQDIRSVGRTFLDTVRNADEAVSSKILNGIDELDSVGERMVGGADEQRALLREYSTRSQAMATRTREAIDRAWMLFGRVFARESLVALNAQIVELRRRSETLDGMRGSDLDAVLDGLAADEAAIAATLVGDETGLTKSQGGDWLAQMGRDLVFLSDARTKLQRLDVHQSVLATRFADLESRLERSSDLALRTLHAPAASTTHVLASESQPAAIVPLQEVFVADAAHVPLAMGTVRPQDVPEGSSHIGWISAATLSLIALLAVAMRGAFVSRRKREASSYSAEAAADDDRLTIAFDRVSQRLTHVESALAQIEPLYVNGTVAEQPLVAVENEGLELRSEDARISVLFDDADRRAPKKASAHGRADTASIDSALAEQDLRRRFENDELELVVQPELDTDTLEVESVEARVSFSEPDGRFASTSYSPAVSEQSDLIVRIGDWALRSAIEMAARWHHGNWPQVRVTVNVASAQLVDSRFVERVKALLDERDLPPQCIEIGLTDAVLRNAATRDALRRLREHGLGVGLNDFGVGYSSLASLQQMPLTRIKLHRSLAIDIDTQARLPTIARNVVRWAEAVGLRLSPEGAGQPDELAHVLREGSSCALRHFMRCDQTGAPGSQQEWAPSYESYIVFRESFVLNQIAPGERDVASRRASIRAD